MKKLLIANRGEIAIRIAHAAAELGLRTVAVAPGDDTASRHLRHADEIQSLPGRSAAAYLDIDVLITAARASGADALHPGYGLLSESADLAQACEDAGLTFIGPAPQTLRLLGDKAAARALAHQLGVPLLRGTRSETTLTEAQGFLDSLGPGGAVMLKALAGGGGRGMRVVRAGEDLAAAFALCAAESLKAFGQGGLYVEQFVDHARHIEVQILGDGKGGITHFGERECSLQRRNQKVIEFAPSVGLPPKLRTKILAAACKMAASQNYLGLGTFEFLIPADFSDQFWFMEANPRVQVEHTVTEEVTGVDLVQAQIRVCAGETLNDLGLTQPVSPRGFALQLRVCAERQLADGTLLPASGRITRYELPSGPGTRIDGCGFTGFVPHPGFDTLIEKLILSTRQEGLQGYRHLLTRAQRVLDDTRLDGIDTNLGFLHALLGDEGVQYDQISTGYIAAHLPAFVTAGNAWTASRRQDPGPGDAQTAGTALPAQDGPAGTTAVAAPLSAAVAELLVKPGDQVIIGQPIAVLEAMKMEHSIAATVAGEVIAIAVRAGEFLSAGQAMLHICPAEQQPEIQADQGVTDLDALPSQLREELDRRARRMDAARSDVIAKRHAKGLRSLRENIAQLTDPESFVEYGGLAIASQRRRRSMEELIRMSPGDGMVTGTATINGATAEKNSRALVIGYDYTVLAGTQGWANHRKLGRMLQIAARDPLPIVLFAEGGGGRPGDTDQMRSSGLDTRNFAWLARLSGRKPIIGIVTGRCFAGNAALLGLSDVVIATRSATIGMGGPAMIEGGGLGVYSPEEVGPAEELAKVGAVDLLVTDEAEAVELAKKYLSYFQGRTADWAAADQRRLRHILPENRRMVYDVREVIEGLCDTGSVLELRRESGPGMLTCLARIEGQAVGVIANNNRHIAGAIDTEGAHKATRFLKLCDRYDLPVISLCDTPGFLVGPDSERLGAVRIFSRMFQTGANMRVPLITIVLRKGYGLGAMGMAGGSMAEPCLAVAWPGGEFGGMGLEGAVRLGYRNELAAIKDPAAREAEYRRLVDLSYEVGRAYNAAAFVEIDDVIDPAETRDLITRTLRERSSVSGPEPVYIDAW